MLTLKAFGALDFRDDACASVPALLAQPKRAALLAYLVLAHPDAMCRRDTLLALFWPDLDQEGGRHALSQALSFLRRHLPEGTLAVRGNDEVGVDPARVRSDVGAFRHALADGAWSDALSHYQGELLQGLHVSGAAPFTDWLDRERERLREAAADAAWKHAHALVAAGSPAEAERTAQRALHLVPTDESAVRGFIRALAAGGDRAAALRFYEKFASVLAVELEVDPAPETRAVADAIRSGQVPVAPIPATPPGPPPSPSPEAFRTPPAGLPPRETEDEAPPVRGAEAGTPMAGTVRGAPREFRRRLLLAGVGAVALAATGLATTLLLRSPPGAVMLAELRPVSVEPGIEFLPALSPDGRNVAFVRDGSIVVRSVDHVPGRGEVVIADPAGGEALFPAWTADGESVRFLTCASEESCVWKEGHRTGGALRTPSLPDGVPTAGEGVLAWSEDGARLAFFRGDTLFVAEENGGPRPVYPFDPERRRFGKLHSPVWSPDGTRIAFVNGRQRAAWPVDIDPASIWVVDVRRGTGVEIVGGEATNGSPVWLDDGTILFASNRDGTRALYAVEVGAGGARGQPRLIPGVADPHTLSYSRASRRLVWSRFTTDRNIRSYPLDPPAPALLSGGEPVTTGSQLVWIHDVSRDGKWIVYDADLLGNTDLYKASLETGEVVRLTDTPRDELSARWSPDGREIAFTATPPPPGPGEYEVFVMDAAGGAPVQVTRSPSSRVLNVWPTWAPDGLALAYSVFEGGVHSGGRITRRDSVGGAWSEPTFLAPGPFGYGVWTPDGRSIVYNPRGAGDVIHEVSPDGDTLWSRDIAATSPLLSFGETMVLRASHDGTTLYSRGRHKDGTLGVWALPDRGRGAPRLVVRYDDPLLVCHFISIGPDRVYLTVERNESDVWVATVRR